MTATASHSDEDSSPPTLPPPSYASLATPLAPSFPHFSSSQSHARSPALEHSHYATGLPSGYFLIRSKEPDRQRTFDVRGRGTAEGTEVCLHPVKQPHVPKSNASLRNQWNNQIFYLDWNGTLMSASAEGRAVDCMDGLLRLSLPSPIFSIPSRASHPLPHFSLDPTTSVLFVRFSYDPLFPGPGSTSSAFLEDDYIVESVPVPFEGRKKTRPVSGAGSQSDDTPAPVVWATGLLSGLERLGSGLFGRTPTSATFPPLPSPPPFPSSNSNELPLPPTPRVIPPWDREEARISGSQVVFDSGDLLPEGGGTLFDASDEIHSTPPRLSSSRIRDHSLPPLPPSSPLALPLPSTSAASLSPSLSTASLSPLPPTSSPALSSPALSHHSHQHEIDDDPSPSSPDASSDEDSDSSPDAYRPLRVIRLPRSWREKFPQSALLPPIPGKRESKHVRIWRRRQWESVPVVVRPVEDPTLELPLPALPSFPTVGALVDGGWVPSKALRPMFGGIRRERGAPTPLELGEERGRGRMGSFERSLPNVPKVQVDEEMGEGYEDAQEVEVGKVTEDAKGKRTGGTDKSESGKDAQIVLTPTISGLCISVPSSEHGSDSEETISFPTPDSITEKKEEPYWEGKEVTKGEKDKGKGKEAFGQEEEGETTMK